MDKKQFSEFIVLLRKEKSLTQKDVSEIFSVSPQAVSKWENGDSIPDIEILEKMSEFYNVSINELIEGKRKDQDTLKDTNINSNETLENKNEIENKENKKKINIFNIIFSSCILFLIFIFSFVPFFNVYLTYSDSINLYQILTSNNYLIGNFVFLIGLLLFIASITLGIIYSINGNKLLSTLRSVFAFSASAIYLTPCFCFLSNMNPNVGPYIIFTLLFAYSLISLYCDKNLRTYYKENENIKINHMNLFWNEFLYTFTLAMILVTTITNSTFGIIILVIIMIMLILCIVFNGLYNVINKKSIYLTDIILTISSIVLIYIFAITFNFIQGQEFVIICIEIVSLIGALVLNFIRYFSKKQNI